MDRTISKLNNQTTTPVELVYNKPIKRGKSKRDGKLKVVERTDRTKFGGILDKHIQNYTMWFLFLKLALELEQQDAVLILKKKRKVAKEIKNKIILQYKTLPQITKKVRVNRERYEGWDLDQVLTLPFNKWFGKHMYLFRDEGIKVLSSQDAIGDEPHHLYLRIDKRRRATDTVAEIRKLLPEQRHHKTQSKFPIHGNPRHLVLMNKYNALVLKMKGWRDKEILHPDSGYMRLAHTSTIYKKGYSLNDAGRTMFDLISGSENSFGAKQILLSVCDGFFVMNPDTSYMK